MYAFLGNIINLFYSWTGNFGIAVILFTLLVKGLLLPLDIKSKNSTAKMQALQPKIEKINEKYKNDPDKKNRKIQELYMENNISPLGGCLPILITFPIIIIVFVALRKYATQETYDFLSGLLQQQNPDMGMILTKIQGSSFSSTFENFLPTLFANPTAYENPANLLASLKELPQVIGEDAYQQLIQAIKGISESNILEEAARQGYRFLWVKNIMVADSGLKTLIGTGIPMNSVFKNSNGYFVLPILSTALQYVQTWLTMRKQPKSAKTGGMAMMNKLMPLISLYFCTVYSATFALYWTISTLISVVQMLVMDWLNEKKKNQQQEEPTAGMFKA